MLQDIIDKGYSPIVYRMFCYTTVYRRKINFTWEAMDSAKISLERLKEAYQKHLQGNEIIEDNIINNYEEKFNKAINDDLNIPLAMSVVWEVAKNSKKSIAFAKLLKKFDSVLALDIDKLEKEELPEEIKILIDKRKQARENKNWEESDKLRDQIQSMGYIVKDLKDGIKVEKM